MDTNKSKVLVIIPARGGSKSIPRKNVLPLDGKPLIAYTIEQAQAANLVNRVIVSTDNAEIESVSVKYGAEVIPRPDEISGDTDPSESALIHSLSFLEQTESYKPDLVVFLQCTSPVRQPTDIDRAIQTLKDDGADSLLSVVRFHTFMWHFVNGEAKPLDYDYRSRPRRQDRKLQFIENGSIYVFKPSILHKFGNRLGGRITLHEMDSSSSVDINTIDDFELCESLLTHSRGVKP